MRIGEAVKELISDISGVELINEYDGLQEDLALDSLDMVTMLVGLEDRLDIELCESDMNPFDLITVKDVIDLAEKYTYETDC